MPDFDQDGVEWLDLEGIATLELYPRSLAPYLAALGARMPGYARATDRQQGEHETPVYLGDVN